MHSRKVTLVTVTSDLLITTPHHERPLRWLTHRVLSTMPGNDEEEKKIGGHGA